MKATKLGERFFESTRGRIITLLRGGSRTVNELTAELGLTDNAVRGHLLSLERDGLIRQSGVQPGHRKPHFSYELTAEAEHLFPKAYDALLNQLISVLKDRLPPEALDQVLREVGRSIAGGEDSAQHKQTLEARLEKALQVLESLGGSAKIEKDGDGLIIRSGSCPLAAAVSTHPEVCKLAETLVSTIVGVPVRERCDRDQFPRCRFEVAEAEQE